MFTSIKTSRANKDIVTDLSRKFNLGAENIIARIALTYSLSKDRLLSLTDIADSQGKEYSKNVLFGNNLPYYIGLICVKYGLYKTDKDIPKDKDNCILLNFKVFRQISYKNEVFFTLFFSDMAFYQWRAISCK